MGKLHMMKIAKAHIYEWLVYALLWAQVLLFPVISALLTSTDGFSWQEDIFPRWLNILPFFALFLLHNFVLIPRLFLVHRVWWYIVSVVGVLIVFCAFLYERPHKDFGRPGPGMDMHRPMHDQQRPPLREPRGETPFDDPPFGGDRGPEHRPPHGIGLPKPLVMDSVIALLLLGANMAIVLLFRYQRAHERTRELETSNLQHELEYLKAQLNPHFFMNMLNNIHGMVEVDPDKAQDMILQLSKLMRYVLYEGARETTPLTQEIAFVDNYVALMRRRYSDKKVSIELRLPEHTPEALQIPPLLFIVFIENAFKHGVSYRLPSFVDIQLALRDGNIVFRCENSNVRGTAPTEPGGVGLENVRKRLALLYGDRYTLTIDDGPEKYGVTLTIPYIV